MPENPDPAVQTELQLVNVEEEVTKALEGLPTTDATVEHYAGVLREALEETGNLDEARSALEAAIEEDKTTTSHDY